jgi:putative MFS transporter
MFMGKMSKVDRFQWRVTAIASGGYILDGYILGIIGPVLGLMNKEFTLTAVDNGLLASSILVGILLGAMVFGYITDLVGRHKLMVLDLVAFITISVLQFFVDSPTQLIILRFLMGIAIGADYAIASPLVAEFASKKNRGPMLASVLTSFYIGYLGAVVVSMFMVNLGPDSWRYMLISSAVPALLIFIMRLGMPESPRWLISKGRIEEAKKIMADYLEEYLDVTKINREVPKTKYSTIFNKNYRKRTAFAAIFWACQVAPYFAIFSFAPTVLEGLKIKDPLIGELVLNFLVLGGAILGCLIINKVTRRKLVIIPFVIAIIPFLMLGLFPNMNSTLVIIWFSVYALAYSISSILQSVYPPEMFPTEIRATAMGFASGGSRVGAAIGTFLLPIGIANIGMGPTMLFGAGVCLIGAIVSYLWAPETGHLTIDEASLSDIKIDELKTTNDFSAPVARRKV